jgi:hypothetical protein
MANGKLQTANRKTKGAEEREFIAFLSPSALLVAGAYDAFTVT